MSTFNNALEAMYEGKVVCRESYPETKFFIEEDVLYTQRDTDDEPSQVAFMPRDAIMAKDWEVLDEE